MGASSPSECLGFRLSSQKVVVQFTESENVKEEKESLRHKMIPSSGTF